MNLILFFTKAEKCNNISIFSVHGSLRTSQDYQPRERNRAYVGLLRVSRETWAGNRRAAAQGGGPRHVHLHPDALDGPDRGGRHG